MATSLHAANQCGGAKGQNEMHGTFKAVDSAVTSQAYPLSVEWLVSEWWRLNERIDGDEMNELEREHAEYNWCLIEEILPLVASDTVEEAHLKIGVAAELKVAFDFSDDDSGDVTIDHTDICAAKILESALGDIRRLREFTARAAPSNQ